MKCPHCSKEIFVDLYSPIVPVRLFKKGEGTVEWRLGCELKNKELCPYFYEFHDIDADLTKLIDNHSPCSSCGGKIVRAVPVMYDD